MVSKKQSDLWNKGASKTRTSSTATRPTVTNPSVAKRSREDLEEEVRRRYGQTYERDADDGERDFLDRLSNLTANRRRNKQLRQNEQDSLFERNLYSMQRRNDLDQLAAAGRQRLRNGVFDLTSMTGKSAEEQGVVGETRDDAFHQNAYDFMTPQQRSIYEAFIGLGDRKSAKSYLASIEEGLQQQAADKLLQTIQPGNIENVQDFADVTRLGVRSGIGRFETGVQQLTNPNAVSKNYTEMAFEEARKDMSGVTGIVADLANTVGFMLLPAGGSMVLGLAGGAGLAGSAGVKALSASLFGAASGGSTYNDMLKENPGTDKFDAKVYSVINGALEGSLQYALGGIGKLGVGGLSKVTGKTISGAIAKKLSNVAKASANTPVVKGLIKALVGGGKWAAGASDEALEEWLQAVLDPVMRNYVLGENNEVKLFGEDQLYAAFLGALGATVMNAPNNVSSFANAEQILNETVAKQETKAAARANKGQPVNAEAQAIPEATKEQIEAHMDNPDVKDLVIQINRLEAGIATGKSRHNDSPTGRKAQLAKAKKDLATLIAKLEQQQAPAQEQAAPADIPEMPKAPVENEANIPELPKAPVGNNVQSQQVTDENIAEVLTEGPASADNRNGIDLVNKGLEMARGERGRGLVQEGMRNGTEGIISPPVDTTRPAGERQEPQPRNLSLAETRRQNVQNSRNEAQDIIDDGEAKGLIDSKVADSLREALDSQAETALESLNNRAEQSVPLEVYNRMSAYLERQKNYLSAEDYTARKQALEEAYHRDATEAGLSEEEAGSGLLNSRMANADVDELFDTRYSINHNDGTTEDEQVDRLIDALIERLQGWGNLDSFERTSMAEDVAGSQSGRNISVNENLRGTAEEANAVAHETGHLAARIDPKLAPDILGIMRNEGYDVDSMVEERRNAYREDFGRLGIAFDENKNDTAFFEEEVAMGFVGDICENNPELLNKIATEQPSIIRRILDALRKVIDTLTGKERDVCEVTIERLNSALMSQGNSVENQTSMWYNTSSPNNNGRIENGREQDESEIAADYRTRPEGSVQGLPRPAVSGSNPSLPGEGNGGRRNPELARGILALQKQGKSFTDLGQSEGPEYFYNRIGEAKRTNPFGAFVTQHEIEEYDGMNLLTDSTGTVGVAVTEDGNIVSVFKDANSPVKGAMTSILFNALSNGGVKLDNFNSEALSYMYAQHGFIPVARTAFVDEFAPDDWNYERDGRPDIVFWVHNGDSLETIANNIGSYEEPDYGSLPMFDDYDKAEAYRDGLVAGRNNEDVTRYSIKRRNSTTKEENLDKLVPENREALEPLKNHEYKPESMDETTAKAWEWIEKHGGTNDDITEPYTSLMNKKGEWKPTEMEAALVMFGSLAQNGDENSASALAAKIIGQAPDFGRVINYFKILQRYMPNAVSAISRSIADQIDVELTDAEKANIDLCDRIAKQGFISDSVKTAATPEFREWLEEASEYVDRGQLDATTAAYAAAMSLVTAKQPSTARQKFRALQRISLLSNPKTHFRNILGNVAEQAGSIMSRPGADLTDRFISKFTKQRTFGSGGAEAFAKAVTDSVEKAVMDHALGINTVGNKFDEDTINRSGLQQLARQNAFDEKTHKALRNGISRVANNIDHLIGLGLSIGDAPFLIGTYEAALAQIMNANNATEATEEMMDTAWDVAFRRTFRDNNAVTKALTGIRNSLPFIGETIAPYVQTPVNVVLTAIQYSPIGVGEAFFKAFVDLGGSTSLRTQLKNNESTMKTQRQIAELVGRGALGTAAMLVGALLASAGRITGDDDDIDSQKEKNWNTATGRKGSSIKIGDTYIDPSSLQSLSTPIMAGAAAYEGKEEGDGTDWAGILGAAVKASMKMGNTMLEMPVLQGVADLFSGNYDNGELLAGALSLAGNAATQVVPFGSLLKQAGKAVDPYSRVQSEINAGPGERVLKSTVNNLKTMLPGTRKTLSQRYDVLGNPIKNDASDNVAERLYNSFINPFNTSKENTNEVTDEIDRLYAALQDTDVLPSAAGNSISYGGEKYKFTSAEKQEYQRVEGESNAEILSSLVNSEAYDQLTDEEKAKVLSSIYDYSSNKAKADYLKKQGVEYESDAKWMDSIDSIVETGVDIGSAMVYRYELNQIDGADEQAKYIMSLPISADQKKAFDTQFVDKFGFHPITDDRDYTSEDTLALSMTSDSGRGKYDRVFSGDWTAPSGNSYRSLSGVEFGELYDACYFKSSPTKAESIESIRKMLMEEWGLDGYAAETLATDFRAVMGSKKY